MPETSRPTAIIGTCFSLEKPGQALAKLGATEDARELWFARALRDSFAFSHAGGYVPLREILRAELARTVRLLGLRPSDDLGGVPSTFAEQDPRPNPCRGDQGPCRRRLAGVALTMGAAEATRGLFERAGVADRCGGMLSCDAISVTKPNRAVYELALERSRGEACMVAAHAWDIAGESRAGLRTAFATSVEGSHLDVDPKPDVIADSLLEAARAMVQL